MEPEFIQKGRKHFLILVSFFLLSLISFYIVAIASGIEISDIAAIFLAHSPLLIFFYLTRMGHEWARWVLSIILIPYAFLYFTLDLGAELIIKTCSLLLVYSAIALHISNAMKAYFDSKKKPLIDEETEGAEITNDSATIIETIEEISMEYPSLTTRIKSIMIDYVFILMVVVLYVTLKGEESDSTFVLNIILACLVLSYEPVLNAFSSTIGQRVTGIKVRSYTDINKRISLPMAYLRFITKIPLGIISYVTIHFNKKRRAIHDMLAGSIILYKDQTEIVSHLA